MIPKRSASVKRAIAISYDETAVLGVYSRSLEAIVAWERIGCVLTSFGYRSRDPLCTRHGDVESVRNPQEVTGNAMHNRPIEDGPAFSGQYIVAGTR